MIYFYIWIKGNTENRAASSVNHLSTLSGEKSGGWTTTIPLIDLITHDPPLYSYSIEIHRISEPDNSAVMDIWQDTGFDLAGYCYQNRLNME